MSCLKLERLAACARRGRGVRECVGKGLILGVFGGDKVDWELSHNRGSFRVCKLSNNRGSRAQPLHKLGAGGQKLHGRGRLMMDKIQYDQNVSTAMAYCGIAPPCV